MSDPKLAKIGAKDGMLAYLVGRIRPDLARRIEKTGRIETGIIGLGQAGGRHAGLMLEYGTSVTAAVAPGQGGTRVHETIPVYETVAEMLKAHPAISAVSIWKHYTTAADAAVEAIEARIPIVVIISEGIPAKDFRRVLVAARKRDCLVLGPNTPGVIFPPERVKLGMLPDVFSPAEPDPGRFTPEGVTICSRSGAILYHVSDALASAGISQNAVIGVGGDSAVGSPFARIVPIVMGFPHTDVVVVAGEIGGTAEEQLAADLVAHPEKYPKPMVALITGRCAPEGKRMGHAGAIVAPGAEYGTYKSKKSALEQAGVVVVNSQQQLVDAVKRVLKGRTYFAPESHFSRMREMWDAPPPAPSWGTRITKVAPNNIVVRGRPLASLIGKKSLLEVAALLVDGSIPPKAELSRLDKLARGAAALPVPKVKPGKGEDISKGLAAMLLSDPRLSSFEGDPVDRTAFCLGRVAAYFGSLLGNRIGPVKNFAALVSKALGGSKGGAKGFQEMFEAAIVACVDHGVTPPSTQGTRLASSVRAAFEVSLASGVANITDVHGGAGAKAAEFFLECRTLAQKARLPLRPAAERVIRERLAAGARIEGLGHRVHTRDPRRDVLLGLSRKLRLDGPCVEAAKVAEEAFESVKGISLPLNVDGAIGAVVADMGFSPRIAKAVFIFGRVAGLAAHHFEEVTTQPPMRRINFAQAVYRGD